MKSFFSDLWMSVRTLLTSKKFLVAAGSTAAAIASGQDPKTALLVGGAAYVTGQGVADIGKNRKP